MPKGWKMLLLRKGCSARRARLRWLAAATLSVLASAASGASAAVVNAGFETGDFTGYTRAGDGIVGGTLGGIAPAQGSFQAELTTESVAGDGKNLSGTDSVSAATLESFLGLSSGTLAALGGVPSAIEGTAIRQTIAAAAGDVIHFQFDFLTLEKQFFGQNYANDFAFATLHLTSSTGDTTNSVRLAGVSNTTLTFNGFDSTGYLDFSFTAPTAGNYLLGFGVVDAFPDARGPSVLLLDGITQSPAPAGTPAAVPLPAAAGTLPAAALLVGFAASHYSRRRPSQCAR
jgi:hypothetical protein